MVEVLTAPCRDVRVKVSSAFCKVLGRFRLRG